MHEKTVNKIKLDYHKFRIKAKVCLWLEFPISIKLFLKFPPKYFNH